jgi:hypothetical protein
LSLRSTWSSSAGDLWVVTSYFNPAGYETRRKNLAACIAALEHASVPYLVVECASADKPFELEFVKHVLQVRSRDTLWQKERLLNLGVAALPPECHKVAWLDCDLVFEGASWAREASQLLNSYNLVQPYSEVVRHGWTVPGHADGERYVSFARRFQQDPDAVLHAPFRRHGHTGFAWAARREILERVGLYERAVAGGADHLMAHASCGDWNSNCLRRTTGDSTAMLRHFQAWAQRWHAEVRSSISCVDTVVHHLWHGERRHRGYLHRARMLQTLGYDPWTDVEAPSGEPLRWCTDKPWLHQWMVYYFNSRHEDGLDLAACLG